MNRRTLLRAAAISSTVPPAMVLAQDADGDLYRELVIHTVHEALRKSSPLLIYSGLARTYDEEPLLTEAAGRHPAVEVWNDWNDTDLQQVFGAFTVGTPDITLGTYRIFDTPDIAHGVHQPMIDEFEQGYFAVGGVRASRLVDDDNVFVSLRIWNVIIDGVAEDERQTTDVMLGLVRHLGRAIGAID